jgi:hypothetical protein
MLAGVVSCFLQKFPFVPMLRGDQSPRPRAHRYPCYKEEGRICDATRVGATGYSNRGAWLEVSEVAGSWCCCDSWDVVVAEGDLANSPQPSHGVI